MTEKDNQPSSDQNFDMGILLMEAYMRMSEDEILNFLFERASQDVCPYCGTNKWVLPLSVKEASAGLTVLSFNNNNRNSYVSVLPVVCENCGNVRMHATATLGKWKVEKEESEKS